MAQEPCYDSGMTKNEAPALIDLADLSGVEDDETPITRLWEDENPLFTDPEVMAEFAAFMADEDEDFMWGLSVHNNG